jgi:hypothetical protein
MSNIDDPINEPAEETRGAAQDEQIVDEPRTEDAPAEAAEEQATDESQ